MTGINHAMTGALIVSVVSAPIIGLPLAFASHFVLDSLPHYGKDVGGISKLTKTLWLIDLIAVPTLVLTLLFSGMQDRYLFIAGIVAAVSPDFVWVYRLFIKEKFGTIPPGPKNKFNQFHSNIQKYEFKNGVFIEVAVTLCLTLLIFKRVL